MEEILKSRDRIFLQRTVWGTLLALFLIFMFHYFSGSDTDVQGFQIISHAVVDYFPGEFSFP
jgi:uncharacterized membrane protein